jgi:transposase-like protein
LRARSDEDVLITSIDGLKGFPEAIAEVFPQNRNSAMYCSSIRNSLKYVVSKDQKAFMADLKLVYRASSLELAEHHLLELGEKWGKRYPAVMKSWNDNWENLSQYFKYPEELRRIIYTTNIVEGFTDKFANIPKIKALLLVKMLY